MWMLLALLGASELPYDGVDQDGDGVDLVDVDADGWIGSLALGPDCNDRDPGVRPDALDLPGDRVDRDCDGSDGSPVWVTARRLARDLAPLMLMIVLAFAAGRAIRAGPAKRA